MESEISVYLGKEFENFSFRKPIFRLNDSIRFELGPESISTAEDAYFKEAISRAKSIMKSLIQDSDFIDIIYQECTDGNQIKKSELLSEIFGSVHSTKSVFPYPEDEDSLEWKVLSKTMSPDWSLFNRIISGIIHQDFPSRSPILNGEIYFLNRGKNLIINIYDDRGMDVGSNNIENLRTLYQEFNHWILDYDRIEIDKKFGHTASNNA